MKVFKIILSFFIVLMAFSSSRINKSIKEISNEKFLIEDQSNKLKEQYKEITLYLLLPYIDKEIDKYYLQYLKNSPTVYQYYPYTEVISIEKMYSGEYQMKLRIRPVYGPHLVIGMDEIILKIGAGNVKVVKFHHLRSYEIPDNYADNIKEGYNNPIP